MLPSFPAHLITYETGSASASYEAQAQRRGMFSLGGEEPGFEICSATSNFEGFSDTTESPFQRTFVDHDLGARSFSGRFT